MRQALPYSLGAFGARAPGPRSCNRCRTGARSGSASPWDGEGSRDARVRAPPRGNRVVVRNRFPGRGKEVA